MVELIVPAYEYDNIPFVTASVVAIDAELSDNAMATAQAVPTIPSRSSNLSDLPASETTTQTMEDDRIIGERIQASKEVDESQRTLGAGAAAAVVGMFMGGPILSLMFGFGTAYYSKKEGATGDFARALGDVALVAREKWHEIDSKHNILDTSREVANKTIKQIQDAEKKQEAKKKIFTFVSRCWRNTLTFVEEHRLVERGSEQLKILAKYMAKKMEEKENRLRDRGRSNH